MWSGRHAQRCGSGSSLRHYYPLWLLARSGSGRWHGRAGSRREHVLCHPGSVTYDRGTAGAVACRCCAASGASRCAPSATRWPRTRAGPGPTGTSAASGANRAGWAGSCRPTAGVPTRCRCWWCSPAWCSIRPSPAPPLPRRRPRTPSQGPPTIGSAGTAIIGAPPRGLTAFDANLPTGHPARGRPVHRGRRQDLAHRAGHHPEGRPGHREDVHLHRRGGGRRRHLVVRRRRGLRPDGHRDAGQSQELDPQPAVRIPADRRQPRTSSRTSGCR